MLSTGDGGIAIRVTLCPLLRGALASGDFELFRAVAERHPETQCPAARRERAA